MFNAIMTKYLPATDYKGSRIKASNQDGKSITIPYPHELSGEDVHRKAAEALCEREGWTGKLVGGATKDGYAFVFCDCYPAFYRLYKWATGGNRSGNPYGHSPIYEAGKVLGEIDF